MSVNSQGKTVDHLSCHCPSYSLVQGSSPKWKLTMSVHEEQASGISLSLPSKARVPDMWYIALFII